MWIARKKGKIKYPMPHLSFCALYDFMGQSIDEKDYTVTCIYSHMNMFNVMPQCAHSRLVRK